MKKLFSILLILGFLMIVAAGTAQAQSATQLQLGLTRDFGYGGFGNDIQGLFSLKIKNPPENLTRVEFFIDSTLLGEDSQAPFSLQFNTDSYALGAHALKAVGITSDGAKLESNALNMQFVPAGAATGTIAKIVLPIFGLLLLMVVVSVFVPLVLNKGKLSSLPLGATRSYGIGGGAICPKCQRPFPLRLWWINLGFQKIDRCPYCGKWSLLRRSSPEELRAAEMAELSQAQADIPVSAESEAEKTKKDLDDSRFQNM